MADICATYTYAGVTINGDPASNALVIDLDSADDGITGLDGAPIRRQVDPLASTNGGDSQEAWWGHRIITFSGLCQIGTVPVNDIASYRAALMTLQAAVIAALEAQRDSAATLAWTPANGGVHTISCKYGMPGGEIRFGGPLYKTKFSFTLLAENPTISVA